jgi:hypothetical protein
VRQPVGVAAKRDGEDGAPRFGGAACPP